MRRLSEIDLPAMAPGVPAWVVDIATALVCVGIMVIVRLALDTTAPGAAPFALLFPFALTATLFSGWRAGALVFFGGQIAAWYYVLPPAGFALHTPQQATSIILVAVAGALMLAVAQAFRDSAKRAGAERAAKLEERELLLRELNHRVTNNFQMVASILQLQANRTRDESAKAALGGALNRVMSISQAHRNLYLGGDDVAKVDMRVYLEDLCRNLAEALFLGDLVTLRCEAWPALMERDRAVALGLIVNELVTNAAKHAFTDGRTGHIQVTFEPAEQGWRLTVADDGKGLPIDFAKNRAGLGRGLIEAFARQAAGELRLGAGLGAIFILELKA
jgi:two-component sensor histidine kinase